MLSSLLKTSCFNILRNFIPILAKNFNSLYKFYVFIIGPWTTFVIFSIIPLCLGLREKIGIKLIIRVEISKFELSLSNIACSNIFRYFFPVLTKLMKSLKKSFMFISSPSTIIIIHCCLYSFLNCLRILISILVSLRVDIFTMLLSLHFIPCSNIFRYFLPILTKLIYSFQ